MDLLFPNVAHAETVDQFIANVDRLIINPLIVLLFALAVIYFLWGMFMFLANADNEEKRSVGKLHMIYGVIGMTIMVGVFAIMHVVLDTLSIDGINPEQGSVQLDDYNPSYPPAP
ncbi:MAG: hypothetical protein WDN09_03675 [bacterium]